MKNELTEHKADMARQFAANAVKADCRGDVVARTEAMRDLRELIGFYNSANELMARMPAGPSMNWETYKWTIVSAWAGRKEIKETRGMIGRMMVSSSQPFVLFGDVRGYVSEHATLAEAERARESDQEGCASQGGYSDARIYRATSDGWVDEEWLREEEEGE